MADYVLVHGAWCGAWCYEQLADELAALATAWWPWTCLGWG
jgi:hypothetical protein